MRMMGMVLFALASSAWKSRPLNLGNLTSSTRQLTTSGRELSSNSAMEPNGLTLRPTELSRAVRESRKSTSSSTSNTVASSDAARICTECCVTRHSPDMCDPAPDVCDSAPGICYRAAKYRPDDDEFNGPLGGRATVRLRAADRPSSCGYRALLPARRALLLRVVSTALRPGRTRRTVPSCRGASHAPNIASLHVVRRWSHAPAVGGLRKACCLPERCGERGRTAEAHHEADLRHRLRGICQQGLGLLDSTVRLIAVRRRSE